MPSAKPTTEMINPRKKMLAATGGVLPKTNRRKRKTAAGTPPNTNGADQFVAGLEGAGEAFKVWTVRAPS